MSPFAVTDDQGREWVADTIGTHYLGERHVRCPFEFIGGRCALPTGHSGDHNAGRVFTETCECDPMGEGLDHHPWCGRHPDFAAAALDDQREAPEGGQH